MDTHDGPLAELKLNANVDDSPKLEMKSTELEAERILSLLY